MKKQTISEKFFAPSEDTRPKELFLFGEVHWCSKKYFKFKRIIDKDNIILLTNNITEIKHSPAMIVGNQEAVFLKEWQIQPVMNYWENLYTFAVKLNRQYFKVYKFSTEFDDVYFDKTDTFDDLYETAKEQEEVNLKLARGWGKRYVDYRMWRR